MAYSDEVLADSPVAYWRMGEASGHIQDSANTNHSTTIGGTPVYSVAGALAGDANTAIQLVKASAEYFVVPDHADLDVGDGPFTIEFWAKRDSVGVWQQVMDKGNATAYSIYFYTDNILHAEKATVGDFVISNAADTDTGWHHWVVQKNAGTTRLIYRDGVDVTGTATARTLTDGTTNLAIGAFTAAGPDAASYFNGSLDEIAIYKSILSSTRILAHYNAGISGGVPVLSQGPLYPGTVATLANAGSSENAEAWVTPANAGADDGTTTAITAATFDLLDISELLVCSNFGATIPTDATIVGIKVEVDRNNAAGAASDNRLQLAKGTTFASLVGSNKADTATDWPAALASVSYGTGTSDMWGTTWTPAEINASTFAVMLSVQADGNNTDVAADYVRATVYYTAAARVPRFTSYPQILAH